MAYSRSIIYVRQPKRENRTSGYGVSWDDMTSLGGMSLFYPSKGEADVDQCGSKPRQKFHGYIYSRLRNGTKWKDMEKIKGEAPSFCSPMAAESSRYDPPLSWAELFESGQVLGEFRRSDNGITDCLEPAVTMRIDAVAENLHVLSPTTAIIPSYNYWRILLLSIMDPARSLSNKHKVIALYQQETPHKSPIASFIENLGLLCQNHAVPSAMEICNFKYHERWNLKVAVSMNRRNKKKIFSFFLLKRIDNEEYQVKKIIESKATSLAAESSIMTFTRQTIYDSTSFYTLDLAPLAVDDIDEYTISVGDYLHVLSNNGAGAYIGSVHLVSVPLISGSNWLGLKAKDTLTECDADNPFQGLAMLNQIRDAENNNDKRRRLAIMPAELLHFPPLIDEQTNVCDNDFTPCCSDDYLRIDPKAFIDRRHRSYKLMQALVQTITPHDMKSIQKLAEGSDDGLSPLICIKPTVSQGSCVTFKDDKVDLCICETGYDGMYGHCVIKTISSRFTLTEGVPTFTMQYYFPSSTGTDLEISSLTLYLVILLDGYWGYDIDRCALNIETIKGTGDSGGSYVTITVNQPVRSRYLFPFIGTWSRKERCKELVRGLVDDDTKLYDELLTYFMSSNSSAYLYRSGTVARELFHFESNYPPVHPYIDDGEADDWVNHGPMNEESINDEYRELLKLRRKGYVGLHGDPYTMDRSPLVVVYLCPDGIWWRRLVLAQVAWIPKSVYPYMPPALWLLNMYATIVIMIILTYNLKIWCSKRKFYGLFQKLGINKLRFPARCRSGRTIR